MSFDGDLRFMVRMIIGLLVVLALAGGAIGLSRIDATKPTKRIEKTVSVDAPAK